MLIPFQLQLDEIHCDSALDSEAIDIDKYLPINSDDEAVRFCGNDDGLYDQRKRALLKRLYAASDVTTITNFVASVCDVFFTTDYQISRRWCTKQWVKRKKNILNLLSYV